MMKLLNWFITPEPEEEHRVSEPAAGRYVEQNEVVRVDIERMERALSSQSFKMPKGLSREEKRKYIVAVAQRQR
jgi:hypothetical protein